MSSEIRLLERNLVAENTKFSVYLDRLQGADQRTVNDYMVVVPKRSQENLVSGVAILPVFEKKVGLLHVYRYPVQSYSWEIPRGFLEKGEVAAETARRELEEETGLVCGSENLREVCRITPEAGVIAGKMQLFIALDCRQSKQLESDDIGIRQFRFFSADEVEEMILSSEIQDPSTLVAFFRCRSQGLL